MRSASQLRMVILLLLDLLRLLERGQSVIWNVINELLLHLWSILRAQDLS